MFLFLVLDELKKWNGMKSKCFIDQNCLGKTKMLNERYILSCFIGILQSKLGFLFVLINLKQPLSNYCQPFYFMKLTQKLLRCVISITFVTFSQRGITGGWAGWANAHPGFARIEGATRQWWWAELLIAHLVLGNHLRPCVTVSILFYQNFIKLATLAIFCHKADGKFWKPKSYNLAGNSCNINRQAVFLSQWIPSNDFLFQGSLETRGACIQKKPRTERYILLMGQIVYSQDMYECGIGERDNLKSINLFSSLAAL